jgi:cysteine synthase A
MRQKGWNNMAKIYTTMTELIGRTPLLEVKKIEENLGLQARILVKLEYFNPAGSVKDRAALAMILDAEERGILKEGAVIIEPTSGNTGIGLAAIAAARGYRAIFTMPETMSVERRKLLQGYGAEIVLTEGKKGMKGAIEKAAELERKIEGAVVLGQFVNPANADAHYRMTGPEIWEDTEGNVDAFVAGVGTGGTITGTGKYLKEKSQTIEVVAVEPSTSAVLSGEQAGVHGIQGIGAGFVPEILDTEIYDRIVAVETKEAYEAAKLLAKEEGILVGISSGAALCAAIRIAKEEAYEGKTIVVLLPDTGERYLSTPLFE